MAVQVPTMEPAGRLHKPPGQQSPLIVHEPPPGTQALPPPGSKQCSAPAASGTLGEQSQQSAASAQLSPAGLQAPAPMQRGTPSPSSLHSFHFGLTSPQQSARADELEQV
jgi:hypothetical protein